jgi:hypothetical protein
MSDPVAEAAAQLAALQSQAPVETPPVEVPNVPAVAGASATAPATAELPNADASTPPAGAATAAAGDSGNVPAVAAANLSSAPSTESDESTSAGDCPNAASVAVEPTTALGSASNAAGESITSTIGASSVESPLHIRIAEHLEAIYQLAIDNSIATETAATRAAATTKTLVGDILFRISNGMAVTEGELVAKLEALYRAL